MEAAAAEDGLGAMLVNSWVTGERRKLLARLAEVEARVAAAIEDNRQVRQCQLLQRKEAKDLVRQLADTAAEEQNLRTRAQARLEEVTRQLQLWERRAALAETKYATVNEALAQEREARAAAEARSSLKRQRLRHVAGELHPPGELQIAVSDEAGALAHHLEGLVEGGAAAAERAAELQRQLAAAREAAAAREGELSASLRAVQADLDAARAAAAAAEARAAAAAAAAAAASAEAAAPPPPPPPPPPQQPPQQVAALLQMLRTQEEIEAVLEAAQRERDERIARLWRLVLRWQPLVDARGHSSAQDLAALALWDEYLRHGGAPAPAAPHPPPPSTADRSPPGSPRGLYSPGGSAHSRPLSAGGPLRDAAAATGAPRQLFSGRGEGGGRAGGGLGGSPRSPGSVRSAASDRSGMSAAERIEELAAAGRARAAAAAAAAEEGFS
ncbi:hypothetical protein JKP88DRAFT_283616 [Tribonema minus]|uniref:Uncharacterized protein n=1 Tax=Tribonema minus TaxID=303371 RepID=A0A835YIY1_9STRA|nr:hypothetical protein JKP88DRAFT_283616 [Tribonema minus]